MNVIIISSALEPRNESLTKAFKAKGFSVLNKWIGNNDWPEVRSDLAGVVFLENGRLGVLDLILEARKKIKNSEETIPLVVLPDDFGPNIRVKYIAAGATHVCSPDETDERVVAEIRAYSDVNVGETSQTRLELLQPFIAATIEAMEIMASIRIDVNKIFRKDDYRMHGDISGIIYLLGKTERLLAVTFPQDTATKMAKEVLSGAVPNPDNEMIIDCVGELANIIAGQVKGRFVHTDYEFDISTPAIVSGKDHEIRHRADLPCYVMKFGGDIGNFSTQLCVRGTENS